MKKCVYCGREIGREHLLGEDNLEKIRCDKCYKELKVSKVSRILFKMVLLIIISLIVTFPINLFIKIMSIILVLIWHRWLKVLLYFYEEC